MNPLAIGLIALGIVLLFYGISSLVKRKTTKGLVFSIMGILVASVPVVVSYFLAG